MNTEVLVLTEYKETGLLGAQDREKLQHAAEVLRDGGLVAFPTETVYGLGGNALLPEAAGKIYAAKGRPSDNPLIVHIASLEELDPLVREKSESSMKLAESFWPGPLTMIFAKNEIIPDATTGGLKTAAVRFPVHPVARELIRLAGVPVAAPSANLSGRPSTTTAEHCIEDLMGRVDIILDGGPSDIGLESTIVDVSSGRADLLRPGAITGEMIRETLGCSLEADAALLGPLSEGVRPKAPGMKYRHYAPKAPMVLVAGEASADGIAGKIAELLSKERCSHAHMALICTEECKAELMVLEQQGFADLSGIRITVLGTRADRFGIAHDLFGVLRRMDQEEADYIIAEGCAEDALGMAIMNRMKKAAAWQIVYA